MGKLCWNCGCEDFEHLDGELFRCLNCGKISIYGNETTNDDDFDDELDMCPMCGSILTGGYCDDCGWIE